MVVGDARQALTTGAGATPWPQFAVVNRSTLPEEIAARVLDLIREEQLHPGTSSPRSATSRPRCTSAAPSSARRSERSRR